ncbi:MAG: hypothetical protein PHP50_09765 [Lachnospiraceae bacterium]|nr:hypothetical protein [Lachnospiraceae bacterium]
MQKKIRKIGGFVGQNRGNIRDCYSVTTVRGKKNLSGDFAADNSGNISNSYAKMPLDALTGGLTGENTGQIENSYFLHKKKANSRSVTRLADAKKGEQLKQLKEEKNYANLGFDTDEIWEMGDSSIPLRFIPKNWNYAVPEEETEQLTEIRISSTDDLLKFAQEVNKGDRNSQRAHVVLTEDLDLKGKEWITIGINRFCAFEGIFDGGGHTIRNFTIKKKETVLKGFFGCLKGQVYNLTVDCLIGNGSFCGGLAAQNEGVIGCCAAVLEIKDKSDMVGGLVGDNSGEIFQSYAAGHIITGILLIPFFTPLAAIPVALLLGMSVWGLVGNIIDNTDFRSTFAPVPYDEDQVPIQGEEIAPNTDGHFVSF